MRHSMAKKMSLSERGVEAVLDPYGKLTKNTFYKKRLWDSSELTETEISRCNKLATSGEAAQYIR
jgi:hypothetical protein